MNYCSELFGQERNQGTWGGRKGGGAKDIAAKHQIFPPLPLLLHISHDNLADPNQLSFKPATDYPTPNSKPPLPLSPLFHHSAIHFLVPSMLSTIRRPPCHHPNMLFFCTGRTGIYVKIFFGIPKCLSSLPLQVPALLIFKVWET